MCNEKILLGVAIGRVDRRYIYMFFNVPYNCSSTGSTRLEKRNPPLKSEGVPRWLLLA